jgi:hypothetical protein
MRTPSHSTESYLQSYRRVSDLVQQGLADQARELALSIPVDHLRCRALLLANDSREFRRPDALRR